MATRRRKPYFDKANRVWVAAVVVGYRVAEVDGADGKKRKRRTAIVVKRARARYEDALKELADLERQRDEGKLPTRAEKVTLSTWLDRWLESVDVSPNTYTDYASKAKHIKTRIGGVQVRALTPIVLDSFFAQLEREGVGRRTQQLIHVVLGLALERARRLRVIGTNPLEDVPRPKLDRAKKRPKPVWTVDQALRFLATVEESEYAALLGIYVTTGIRQSEGLGLTVPCLELGRGAIRIEWALHEVDPKRQKKVDPRLGRGLALLPPKSEASERRIILPASVAEALREHVRRTSPTFLVFTFEGQPIRPHVLRNRIWRPLLEEAGVPPIPMKQLRHTCLTVLAEEGVSLKAAQAVAGHSDMRLTAAVYQQATERMQQEAASAWDRKLEARAQNRAITPPESARNGTGRKMEGGSK